MSIYSSTRAESIRLLRGLLKLSGLPAAARWVKRRVLPSKPPEEVFTKIYQSRSWGDGPSVSGDGSSLEQTARWRAEVPGLLARLGVQSILDAPCGDFFWMREVRDLPQTYIGADIVPSLIAENQSRHAGAGRSFEVLNIVEDTLPRVDLIHCRDCLVHLPLPMALRAIANLKRSGATYLLTTTFPGTGRANTEISVGEWRPLDLCLAPCDFPPPLWIMAEVPTLSGDGITHFKHLALWKLADLPNTGEVR